MDEMLTVLQKEIKIRESKPQISQEVNKPARRDRQVTTGSALEEINPPGGNAHIAWGITRLRIARRSQGWQRERNC